MVSLINVRSLFGRKVFRGYTPKPAAMFQVPLDFTTDLVLKFSADFSDDVQNKWGIAGIQSVKIDNSQNADVLVLQFNNGDVITCPSYSMGIFPVLYNGGVLEFIATSLVAVQCSITFLNTRENAQIWTAKIPVAGTINVSGSTLFVQKTQGAFTDASIALTLGGTAQQIMATNANRRCIAIRNPGTPGAQNIGGAVEPIYISFGAGAAVEALGTWELFPGEQLTQFDAISTQSIWVNAATTGHRITAKYI